MSSNIQKLALRIKENPNDSFSKFALSLELIKIGEKKKALSLFENIRTKDENYVGLYYHLGKLYEEFEENKKAVSAYKDGIEIALKQNNTHAKSELMGALANLEFEMES